MLTLNTDEDKKLQFEVTIQGIDHKKLVGRLKFVVEGVEYGFPVEILSDHISVEVPPLDDIVKMGLREGEVIDCKLDVFGDGFYLNPWNGQFKLKTPVKMEARMTVDDGVATYKPEPFDKVTAEKQIAKSLTVTLKDDQGVQEKKVIEQDDEVNPYDKVEDDEEITVTPKAMQDAEEQSEEDVEKDMKTVNSTRRKASSESDKPKLTREEALEILEGILERKRRKQRTTPSKIKRKTVRESETKKSPLPSTKKKKLVEVVSKSGKKYMVTEAVAAELAKLSESKKVKPKKVKKKSVTITENETDPKRLMESVGMKNSNIQKIMLEKAEAMGGDEPEAQLEALKRLLGIASQENVVDEMNKVHDSLRFASRKGEDG